MDRNRAVVTLAPIVRTLSIPVGFKDFWALMDLEIESMAYECHIYDVLGVLVHFNTADSSLQHTAKPVFQHVFKSVNHRVTGHFFNFIFKAKRVFLNQNEGWPLHHQIELSVDFSFP